MFPTVIEFKADLKLMLLAIVLSPGCTKRVRFLEKHVPVYQKGKFTVTASTTETMQDKMKGTPRSKLSLSEGQVAASATTAAKSHSLFLKRNCASRAFKWLVQRNTFSRA